MIASANRLVQGVRYRLHHLTTCTVGEYETSNLPIGHAKQEVNAV